MYQYFFLIACATLACVLSISYARLPSNLSFENVANCLIMTTKNVAAITINADPIEEYEECMVKAKAMI